MRHTPFACALAALFAAAGVALTAAPAAACGGFFCNNQGIDQSGEDILFSINADGTVTTVVQIRYTGPSETFAWILPVPAEPTVSVGTDLLFQRLQGATSVQFRTRSAVEGTCRSEPTCPRPAPDYNGSSDASAAFADAAPQPDVDVRFEGAVGPYEVAVVAAGNGDDLRNWLGDNGYLIPAAAGAELDHYVALNHFFVALRLQKDRSVGEIQPIVLTSENNEPCVPLRLTRIATVPDMPIRVYFLAEQRYRPFNYMLVNPDLDVPELWTGGASYTDRVTQAVDDAGGRAFVTDYAGDVPAVSIPVPDVEYVRNLTDPGRALTALRDAGLSGDAQLLGVLLRVLPPPDGVPATDFYNCLVNSWCTDHQDYVAEIGFDPGRLVDDIDTAILEPRREARRMLDTHGHLTRLFTTMSAADMTEDPMFRASAELPREHSNVHVATETAHCAPEYFRWTAPRTLSLPSGRSIDVFEGVAYRGTDAEYCHDQGQGFVPAAPMEQLREIAARRAGGVGGGSGCSVGSRAGGLGALGALAFAGLLFVWRRRHA